MAKRPSPKAVSDFVSEAQENIEALDRDLLRLADTRHGQEADPDTLNAVFRAAHSLKGLSAMFGVERMTELTHAFEDRLDDVRMGRQPLDPRTLDLLLAAPALFSRIIREEAAQLPAATGEAAADLATRLRDGAPVPSAKQDPLDGIDLAEGVRGMLTEYEQHRLRANVQKGAHLYRVRARFDLATFDSALDGLKSRLKPAGEVMSTLPSADAGDPSTISFDVLFGSTQALEAVRAAAGDAVVDPIGWREVRMVPLGQIFDKLARMVRKLSRELGKQVELEVRGSEVELDKLIVEELSDPLMHLIRNCLDHAIEPPEARVAAGKAAAGRITLAAEQKGNHVVVSVGDDGAGIDERRVREVAVERGLASAEALGQLSRRDALNLIFLPGFSTAREVTALSGRGVGMDVVKNAIAALSGMIDLQSEPGVGTRVEITLPLTLAISLTSPTA